MPSLKEQIEAVEYEARDAAFRGDKHSAQLTAALHTLRRFDPKAPENVERMRQIIIRTTGIPWVLTDDAMRNILRAIGGDDAN